MTTTEDLVRRALADLAPAVPANDSARAGLRRAIAHRHRRRRARIVAVAAAVVALAAAGAGGLLSGSAGQPDYEVPAGPPAPGPDDGRQVTFAGLHLDLPAGWEAVDQSLDPTAATRRLCLAPAGEPYPRWDDCSGLTLMAGELPGEDGWGTWDDAQPDWSFASDVQWCPASPQPADLGGPQGQDWTGSGEPVTTGYRQVGDRTAFYAEWDASCQVSGFAFSPRVWHLPASRVLIVDVVNRPEVDAILATLRGPGT
jgi:hypothetical protein